MSKLDILNNQIGQTKTDSAVAREAREDEAGGNTTLTFAHSVCTGETPMTLTDSAVREAHG